MARSKTESPLKLWVDFRVHEWCELAKERKKLPQQSKLYDDHWFAMAYGFYRGRGENHEDAMDLAKELAYRDLL